MQATVELLVSVLKVDSALLFIMVVKCVSRKASLATVNAFLLLPTWSEMWSESSFVVLQEDAMQGTEKDVKARAPLPVCSDNIVASLQQAGFSFLWRSGWCPWTSNTRDLLEERPVVYFWLENLAFIGFLESYSLRPVPWKEISESFSSPLSCSSNEIMPIWNMTELMCVSITLLLCQVCG